MIDLALLSVIRRWHLRDKISIREIARRTKLSRNTITKYLASGESSPTKLRLQTPNLGTLIECRSLHDARFAELAQPRIQAGGGDPLPFGHVRHLEPSIRHLADRFRLELIRIPLAAYGHLRTSHFPWP